MSESVSCSSSSTTDAAQAGDLIADDWEHAVDNEAFAERQKRLDQLDTQRAVEQDSLRVVESSKKAPTATRSAVGSGHIRLLRRPQSNSRLGSNGGNGTGDGENAAAKALEEKEALYQRAREQLFGVNAESSEAKPAAPVETGSRILEITKPEIENPSGAVRDHLSDVPMKRVERRNQQQTSAPAPTFTPNPPVMQAPPAPTPAASAPMARPWGYPPMPGPMPFPAPLPGPFVGAPPPFMPPYYMPPPPPTTTPGPVHIGAQQQQPVPLSAVRVNPYVAANVDHWLGHPNMPPPPSYAAAAASGAGNNFVRIPYTPPSGAAYQQLPPPTGVLRYSPASNNQGGG